MACEERTLDFGVVTVGDDESKSLVITNNTESDKVYNVRRDTDSYSIRRVFHIDSTEFVLLPGESHKMNVKFRPDVPFTTCIEYIYVRDKQGMHAVITLKGETIGPYVVPTKKNLIFETFRNITEQTEFELKNVSNVDVSLYFDNDNENSIFRFYPRFSRLEGRGSLTVVARFSPSREGSYEKKVFCLVEHQNPILFHLTGLNGRFPITGGGPTISKFPLPKTVRFERSNYEDYLRCDWDHIVKLEPKRGLRMLKGNTYETLRVTNVTDYAMVLAWETESLNVFRVVPNLNRLNPGVTVDFKVRYDPIKVFNANCSGNDKCLQALDLNSPVHSADLEGWLYWENKDNFLNMVPDPWFFAQDYEEDRWKCSKTPVNITVKLIGNYVTGERKSTDDCVLFPNPLIFPSSFDGGPTVASFQIRNFGQNPILYRLLPPTQTNIIAKPMEGFIKDGLQIVIAELEHKNEGQISHLENWIVEFDGYIESKRALTLAGTRESLDVRIEDLAFPPVQLGCRQHSRAIIRNLSTAWIRLECDHEDEGNGGFKVAEKECLLPPNGSLRHLWISRPKCAGTHSARARYRGKAAKDPKIAHLENLVDGDRRTEEGHGGEAPREDDISSPYPFRNGRTETEENFAEYGINMKINCSDDTVIAQPKVILHTDFVVNQPVTSSFMLCNFGEAFVPYSMTLVQLPEYNDSGTNFDHEGELDEKFYELNPREGVLSPVSSVSVSYTIFPEAFSQYGVLMEIAPQCVEEGVAVPSSGKNICYIRCEGRWPSVRFTDVDLTEEDTFFNKFLLWKALDITRLNRAMDFSPVPNKKSFRLNLPERPYHSPSFTYRFCLRNYSVLPVRWTLNLSHGKLKIRSTAEDDGEGGKKMVSKTVARALSCLRKLVRVQRNKAIETGDASYLDRVDCCVESNDNMTSAIVTREECPLRAIINAEPKKGFIMPGRSEIIEMTALHELLGKYTFSYELNVRVSTFDNNPAEYDEDRESFSESDADSKSKETNKREEGVRSKEKTNERKSQEGRGKTRPRNNSAPSNDRSVPHGRKYDDEFAEGRWPAKEDIGSVERYSFCLEGKSEERRRDATAIGLRCVEPWKATWEPRGLGEREARNVHLAKSESGESADAFPKVSHWTGDDDGGDRIEAFHREEFRVGSSSSEDSLGIAGEEIPRRHYANICDNVAPRSSERERSTNAKGGISEENDFERARKTMDPKSLPEIVGTKSTNSLGEANISRAATDAISTGKELRGSFPPTKRRVSEKESDKSGSRYGKHFSIVRGGRLLKLTIRRSVDKSRERFSSQRDAIGKIFVDETTSNSNLVRKFEDSLENKSRSKYDRYDKDREGNAKKRALREFRCEDRSGSVRISPSSLDALGLGSTDEAAISVYKESSEKEVESEGERTTEAIRITVKRNGREVSKETKGSKSKGESKGFANKERTEDKNAKLSESEGRETTEANSGGKKKKKEGKNRAVAFSSRVIDKEKKEGDAEERETATKRAKDEKHGEKDPKSGKGSNKLKKSEDDWRGIARSRCAKSQSEIDDRKKRSEKCCQELAERRAESKKSAKRPRFKRPDSIGGNKLLSRRMNCEGGGRARSEVRSEGSETEKSFVEGVARIERVASLGDIVCIRDNKYLRGKSVVEAIEDTLFDSRAERIVDLNSSKSDLGEDPSAGDGEAREGEKYGEEYAAKGEDKEEETPFKPKMETESAYALSDAADTKGNGFKAASEIKRSVDKGSSRKSKRETALFKRKGPEEADRDRTGKEYRRKTRRTLFRSVRSEEMKRTFGQIKLLRSFSVLSLCEEAEEANQGRKTTTTESPGRREHSKIASAVGISRGKKSSEGKARSTAEVPVSDTNEEIDGQKSKKKKKNASRKNEVATPLAAHPSEAEKSEETKTDHRGKNPVKYPRTKALGDTDEIPEPSTGSSAMAAGNGGSSRETSESEIRRLYSEPPCWKNWILAAKDEEAAGVESDYRELLKGKTIKECLEVVMESEGGALYRYDFQKASSKDRSSASTDSSASLMDDIGESKAMASDTNVESLRSNAYETESKTKFTRKGKLIEGGKSGVDKRGIRGGFKMKAEIELGFEPGSERTNESLIEGDNSTVNRGAEEKASGSRSDFVNNGKRRSGRKCPAKKLDAAFNNSLIDDGTDLSNLIDVNRCDALESESLDFGNSAEVEKISGYSEASNIFRQKSGSPRNPFPPMAVDLELDVTVTTYDKNEEVPPVYPRLYESRIKMADVSAGNNYSPIQVSWLYNPHIEKCREYVIKEIVYPEEKKSESNRPVQEVYETFTVLNPKGRIKPRSVHPLLLRFHPQMAKLYKALIRIRYDNTREEEIFIEGRGIDGKESSDILELPKSRSHQRDDCCGNSEVYLSHQNIIIDKPIPLHCEAKRLIYMKNSSCKDFRFFWKFTECQRSLKRLVHVSVEPASGVIKSNQVMPFIVSFSNAFAQKRTVDESKREYLSRNRRKEEYGKEAEGDVGTESSSGTENRKVSSESESMSQGYTFLPSDVMVLHYGKQVSPSNDSSTLDTLTSDDSSAKKKTEEELQNYLDVSIAPWMSDRMTKQNCLQSIPSTSEFHKVTDDHRGGIECRRVNVYYARGIKLVEWLLAAYQNLQLDHEVDDVLYKAQNGPRSEDRLLLCDEESESETSEERGIPLDNSISISDEAKDETENRRSDISSDFEAMMTSWSEESVGRWKPQGGGAIVRRYPLTCDLAETNVDEERSVGKETSKCVHISGAIYDEEELEDIPNEIRVNWSPYNSVVVFDQKRQSEENVATASSNAEVLIKDVFGCILWKLLHSEWFEITRKGLVIKKKAESEKGAGTPGEEDAIPVEESLVPFYYNQIVTTDESPIARHPQGGREESTQFSPICIPEVYEKRRLIAMKLGERKSLVRKERETKGLSTICESKLLRYSFPRIIASAIFEDIVTGLTHSIAKQTFDPYYSVANK